MTRTALCGLLAGLTLALGIATAIVQSENHEHGQALNALKEECSMIEAVNGDRAERVLASDWGPLPLCEPAAPSTRSPRPESAP